MEKEKGNSKVIYMGCTINLLGDMDNEGVDDLVLGGKVKTAPDGGQYLVFDSESPTHAKATSKW